MKYNTFYDYYIHQKKMDYNFTEFFKDTPPYVQYDFEGMNLLDKIDVLANQIKGLFNIVFKIYFWESDDQMCCFANGLGENMEILKSYRGKKIPGVGIIYQTALDIPFLRTLLLCHFNKDHSRDPQLEIMPYCLGDDGSSYLVFELYDDRGYNLYTISHEMADYNHSSIKLL